MFKWVHISDIHFCEGTGTDATNMKDRLPECLQKINDANALFITGDFRYAKKDNGNVDSIVEYIDKLCSALKIERDKVFCAPGNHDLERSQKRDRIIESISKDYNPAKGNLTTAQVNELLSGFSFFGDIEKRLYGKCFLAHNTKIHGVKRLDECNIIMLNTAITSGKSGEKEDLILGTQYILDALKDIDPAKPAIMIGHHGHSFLQRKESKKIQNYFKQKKISLYLCGHEHDSCEETVWNGVKQFTAGCICENADASSFRAGFFVGELSDALSVTFTTYKWFPEMEDWKKHDNNITEFSLSTINKDSVRSSKPLNNKSRKKTRPALTTNKKAKKNTKGKSRSALTILDDKYQELKQRFQVIPQRLRNFNLKNITRLDILKKEGIMYYWHKNDDIVESLVLNTRSYYDNPDPKKRAEDKKISAYTSSVSFGCILSSSKQQCKFCATGIRDFKGLLSAEEIALQNIFMASYDASCPDHLRVRGHKREFAFMGQGEPGYSYSAIRKAILLTNCAMEYIGQKVHRYIISTCGISDFMPSLIHDVKNRVFSANRVSLHFSLHFVGEDRKILMPIDNDFSYKDFLSLCEQYYHTSKKVYGGDEKIGIAIQMFEGFSPNERNGEPKIPPVTLTTDSLDSILNELDPKIYKIDLCVPNHLPEISDNPAEMTLGEIKKMLKHIKNKKGFEVKISSSFGIACSAGCGMLKSETSKSTEPIGDKTKPQYENSLYLLLHAIEELKRNGLY